MARYKDTADYLQENNIVLFEETDEKTQDEINRKRSRIGGALAGIAAGSRERSGLGMIAGGFIGAVAGDVIYRKFLAAGKKKSEAASAAAKSEAKRGNNEKAAQYAAKANKLRSQGK